MPNTLKERLIEYLNEKRINKAEFCRTIGVSQAYVTSIRDGVSDKVKRTIAEHYPDLNMTWLVYGTGEMLNDGEINYVHYRTNPTDDNDSSKDKRIADLEAQIEILKDLIKDMAANGCCSPKKD